MFLEGFCGIERQSMSENSLMFSITNEFLLKSSVEYRMNVSNASVGVYPVDYKVKSQGYPNGVKR